MSQSQCHPHGYQCSGSHWQVRQGGEVLQRSKKNQEQEVNKDDAIWNPANLSLMVFERKRKEDAYRKGE